MAFPERGKAHVSGRGRNDVAIYKSAGPLHVIPQILQCYDESKFSKVLK
jgi:hypothetical protein